MTPFPQESSKRALNITVTLTLGKNIPLAETQRVVPIGSLRKYLYQKLPLELFLEEFYCQEGRNRPCNVDALTLKLEGLKYNSMFQGKNSTICLN